MGNIPKNYPVPVIDKTLSVEGAVADAKAVGTKFNLMTLSSPLCKSKFVTAQEFIIIILVNSRPT